VDNETEVSPNINAIGNNISTGNDNPQVDENIADHSIIRKIQVIYNAHF
jgi:hypothetical protein